MKFLFFIIFLLAGCINTDYESTNLLVGASPLYESQKSSAIGWRNWDPKALDDARNANRPILLYFGNSHCPACNLFDHILNQPKIIKLLNSSFIPIRVDRALRPDLFINYLDVAQYLKVQIGEPLLISLTPELLPISFITGVSAETIFKNLDMVRNVWNNEKKFALEQSQRLLSKVSISNKVHDVQIHDSLISEFIDELEIRYDPLYGGFEKKQKHMHPVQIELLITIYQRLKFKQDKKKLEHWIMHTLIAMYSGSIYDHVSGGFYISSRSKDWQKPLLIKPLELNLQMLQLYTKAYQVFGHKLLQVVALDTLRFLQHFHYDELDALYSLYPAKQVNDYTFTENELTTLPKKLIKNIQDNVSGGFVLSLNKLLKENHRLGDLFDSGTSLIKIRASKTTPTKFRNYTARVNFRMVSSLIDLYKITQNLNYVKKAKILFNKSSEKLELKLLPDYVYLAKAALDLFKITEEDKYYQVFTTILKQTERFWNQELKTYLLSVENDLFKPVYQLADGYTENSVFVLGRLLQWQDSYTGKSQYSLRLRELFKGVIKSLTRSIFYHPSSLLLLESMIFPPQILTFNGKLGSVKYRQFINYFSRFSMPSISFLSNSSTGVESVTYCPVPKDCKPLSPDLTSVLKGLIVTPYSWDHN